MYGIIPYFPATHGITFHILWITEWRFVTRCFVRFVIKAGQQNRVEISKYCAAGSSSSCWRDPAEKLCIGQLVAKPSNSIGIVVMCSTITVCCISNFQFVLFAPVCCGLSSLGTELSQVGPALIVLSTRYNIVAECLGATTRCVATTFSDADMMGLIRERKEWTYSQWL